MDSPLITQRCFGCVRELIPRSSIQAKPQRLALKENLYNRPEVVGVSLDEDSVPLAKIRTS